MLDPHVSLRAVAEAPLDLTCIVKAFSGESQPIQALQSADRCHPHRLSEPASTSPPNASEANRGLRH